MKVLAGIAAVLLLVVTSVSMCGYKLYHMIDEFPEQARAENLNQRYAQLVAELNNKIENSDSAYSLANQLENIDYPAETLFVGIQKELDDEADKDHSELPIIDRREANANSKTRVLLNGGGYGRLNDQHFWILQHPLNKYGYDHIELLFERDTPKTKSVNKTASGN